MAYQSKLPLVLDNQLKVQEVSVKLGDQILSSSGVTAVISLGETVKEVRSAIHCDDSVGLALVSQANISIGALGVITLTLANALASGDCIQLKYVLDEQA